MGTLKAGGNVIVLRGTTEKRAQKSKTNGRGEIKMSSSARGGVGGPSIQQGRPIQWYRIRGEN